MGDIELITDGIAREIIEANKENHEELIDTISNRDKTSILLGGKHIIQSNKSREWSTGILVEVAGSGYLNSFFFQLRAGDFSGNNAIYQIEIDGEPIIYRNSVSSGEGVRGTWVDVDKDLLIPFKTSLLLKDIGKNPTSNGGYSIHYILI